MNMPYALDRLKREPVKPCSKKEYIRRVLCRCCGKIPPTGNTKLEFVRAATLTALVCSRRTAEGSTIIIAIRQFYDKRQRLSEIISDLKLSRVSWQTFFLFISWYYVKFKMPYLCLVKFIIYEAWAKYEYMATQHHDLSSWIVAENPFAEKIKRLVPNTIKVEKTDDGLDLLRSI